MKGRAGSVARRLALIAVMAATLESGKLALAAIPNVEVVTLLCGLYGYVFGGAGVIAALIFVGAETLVWGIGPWVVSYLIHWPIVTMLFWLLSKLKIKNRFILTFFGALTATTFGVLTSLVDLGLFSGYLNDFGKRFAIYYARGASFYITQIVTNVVLYLFAFPPLSELLAKLRNKHFS